MSNNDLIKRLRSSLNSEGFPTDLESEAADEIERLTAELADCKESDRLIERLIVSSKASQARVKALEGALTRVEALEAAGLKAIDALGDLGLLIAGKIAATEQEGE